MSSLTDNAKWPNKGLGGTSASGGTSTAMTSSPAPVPMKLFGAWEVDKTPSNCIPRLCTVTINKLILTKESLPDLTSNLVIAVKMQSSKRTLRSNEISVTTHTQPTLSTGLSSMSSGVASSPMMITTAAAAHHPSPFPYQPQPQKSHHIPTCPMISESSSESSSISSGQLACHCVHVDLDLTFALQYPHFLKKAGNHLQILLQRRKYKNRAILGFKTLAGGVINMAEVLQRSQVTGERELDLRENISLKDKENLKSKDHSTSTKATSSEIVGRIIMSSLKSQPVDHDMTTNGSSTATGRNLKVPLNESADVDSEEEVDDFSGSEGSDSDDGANASRPSKEKKFNRWKRHVKAKALHRMRHGRSDPLDPATVSTVHQRNFKQKVIALLKKFKIPDSEASDSEEQAAMEGDLNPDLQLGTIDDIFEFEDSDVDSTQDFDDFSISSTPKPGLKPFFSSKTTLTEENEPTGGKRIGSGHSSEERDGFPTNLRSSSPKPSLRPFFSSKTPGGGGHEEDAELLDSSGTEHTPDTSDTSLKQAAFATASSQPVTQDKKGKTQSKDHPSKVSKDGGSQGASGKTNVKDTIKNLLRK